MHSEIHVQLRVSPLYSHLLHIWVHILRFNSSNSRCSRVSSKYKLHLECYHQDLFFLQEISEKFCVYLNKRSFPTPDTVSLSVGIILHSVELGSKAKED